MAHPGTEIDRTGSSMVTTSPKFKRESEWVWGTRVAAEAAQTALMAGPQDRFDVYRRAISKARQEHRHKATTLTEGTSTPEPTVSASGRRFFDYVESPNQNLSDFIEPAATGATTAQSTTVEKCLAMAKSALRGRWTFHNATEALFWFRCVLKIDPQCPAARLGSARAYQYVASQPWWHNDLRIAKHAATRALTMAEGLTAPCDADMREQALLCGQIYSATGQSQAARRHFEKGMSIDPEYSGAHYFLNFNQLFIKPEDGDILPGLQKAVERAEVEGSTRRLAAALYFRGFANTLFGNYDNAIKDLVRSMANSPRYGAANLALIAATALSRHRDTYKTVRSFKEAYPDFNIDTLDYMWVDRAPSDKYRSLANPIVEVVKAKLMH